MAPAWCVHCEPWKGGRYAYGDKALCVGQVVTPATLSGRPGNSLTFRSIQKHAVTSCARCAICISPVVSSPASSDGEKRERQHLLWKTFFLDHTRWWDNRHQKLNPHMPDFRHKESGEALWLDSCYKPAWVDAQLATLDAGTDHGAPAAGLSDNAKQLVGLGSEHRFTPESVKKLCQQGQVKGAIEVLKVLVGTNSGNDKYLLFFVLKECMAKNDLLLGGEVHALAVRMGFGADTFLCNHFIRMYAGHGKLGEAMDVFRGVAVPDVFMWSSIISAHGKQGQAERAIELYQHMRATRTKPDDYVLAAALQACAAAGDLQSGKKMHDDVLLFGMENDIFICNCLVKMYVKCDSLEDARRVFDGQEKKDVVTWTVMIAGYAKVEGMGQDALSLYDAMHNEGTAVPDRVTYICLLQACANVGVSALGKGKQLHADVKQQRLESDLIVGGSLVNMYAKCGSLADARTVFDRLPEKNAVTWSAMIAGYAKVEGMGQEALSLHSAMHNEGMTPPDAVTFVCLLQACANVGVSALEKGKQLHSEVNDLRLESDMVVGGSLVNMYTKCGSLTDARTVFDGLHEKNVVAWNAMIAGYAKVEGMGHEALRLYSVMHNEGMVTPNVVTFVCLLQACANMGMRALEKGKQLHLQLKERGFESDMVVGGSLVNMYAKCGSLEDARSVFDRLSEKNVVTWSAMISGYAKVQGMGQNALMLYSAMHNEGIADPDRVTFVCLLQACANVGVLAFEQGKRLHSELNERGLESDIIVAGSLVNMYVKCGSLTDAKRVFDGLSEKHVVTWNALMSGYAQHEGMGKGALNIYNSMRNVGMPTPDAVTYVCLLQACASVGALQQGKQLHSEICEGGFESDTLIGSSLVKMYADCGRLEISREVFDRLPTKSLETWTALLKGYAEHGEGIMAIQCFEEILKQGLQPDEVTYICLLTACSHAGLVDQGQQYFDTMEKRHGVEPDERHYTCMVDLLGRSGHLNRAELMLNSSGLASCVVSWTALLSACKRYGDPDLGKRCFDHLVNLQPTVATAYVLMGSIYANAGRWEEVGRVELLRKTAGARKKAAKACIEVKKEVHEFTVGEEKSDVAATLRKMNTRVKEGGHVPQTQLVLRAVSEQEKEDALCGHAEKLALAYGLLNTPAGSPLVVTKNLRMCNDCHSSTKIMSRMEKRQIVVRDGHMVHRFQDGVCSCQDRP